MKFRKKPVVIEAIQWFKNGDHPEDHDEFGSAIDCDMAREKYYDYLQTEGKIVRRYRHPDIDGEKKCEHCRKEMKHHGWIDTLEGGHIVCPGDWVIKGIKGELYPCKPDIFEATYEPVEVE